jgi:alkylation response protein AidB-like acyl-CoA dehydrogenase
VDFDLDADQLALRDAAGALLADHASPARVRAVVDGDDGDRVDRELWKAMVAQGWPGVAVAEDRGGLGLGWVEAGVLLEQVGAHLAPAPILSTMVALDALVRGGAGDDHVAPLIDGSAWAAAAWSGEREVVPTAPGASVIVVVRGDRLLACDLGDVTPQPAMDRTRAAGWIDPAELRGDELGGPDAVRRHHDVGAVAYAAELLGGAQRMLDAAVDYAKQRVQFGKPIGSFQAVKHRCADMLVDVEGMRSAVWWAAWCVSVDHPDASVAASTAKAWCSEAGLRVCESALQVHGGIGFTWECDVHLYLKRAQLDGVAFGGASHHLTRLSGFLRERLARGESIL